MEKLINCPICKEKMNIISKPYTTYNYEVYEEIIGSSCAKEHYKFCWNDDGTANVKVGDKNIPNLFSGSITHANKQNRIVQRWIEKERKNWNKNKRP